MTIEAKLGRASGVARALSAIIPLLPGIAMLVGVVDIPATAVQLVSALSLTAGAVVILLVVNLHDVIARARRPNFVALICLLTVAGFALAIVYVNFVQSHVVAIKTLSSDELLLLPISPSSELQSIVEPFGADYREAVMNPVVGPRVAQLIEAENDTTLVTLVALLLMAQACLTFAVTASIWRVIEAG